MLDCDTSSPAVLNSDPDDLAQRRAKHALELIRARHSLHIARPGTPAEIKAVHATLDNFRRCNPAIGRLNPIACAPGTVWNSDETVDFA